MELSETFDTVAALYDAARPAYPEALVEAVVSGAGLPPTARILEVGPGTGQATALFARRGYSILGLEPGVNLAALAAKNLRNHTGVRIENVSFEDWPLQEARFDLLLSAQAFHWVRSEIRYVKTAQVLKPEGHVALFWNMPPDADDAVTLEIDSVYDHIVPKMADGYMRQPLEERIRGIETEIEGSGAFEDLSIQRFPWEERYDTAQYLRLLDTHSDHRLLPEEQRKALFDGIAGVLTRHGGIYQKPYVAVLYLARKA